MTDLDDFAQLHAWSESLATEEFLERLADRLRDRGQFHELFEVRKMQLRQRLGLPLFYDDRGEELDEPTRTALDDGLIEACREVGEALFQQAKPAEGWMYLRASGDKDRAAELLRAVPVTEERTDELIQVAVYEGVDMGYGFQLLLEHYGICNSITTFEQLMRERSREDQQAAARLLVRSLYDDLRANVAADREQREGGPPAEKTLSELIAGHDELFEGNAYHIDTSHLAAVVRFARLLDDPDELQLGLELSEYGCHLADMFQLPDMHPFDDFYKAHVHYFGALVGAAADVERSLEFFRAKADESTAEGGPDPSAAREVYLDLLVRLERGGQAIHEAVRLYPEGIPSEMAGMLVRVAAETGEDSDLIEYARQRQDLLTFGSLLAARKLR